jgi:hypothetical protein
MSSLESVVLIEMDTMLLGPSFVGTLVVLVHAEEIILNL